MRVPALALLVLGLAACAGSGDERVDVRADGIYVDGRALTFADECCYRPSPDAKVRDPAWSPDGARLVLVIEDVGGTDLWVVRLSDRRAERLTTGPARERDPRWSPDGRTVAYRTETAQRAVAAVR